MELERLLVVMVAHVSGSWKSADLARVQKFDLVDWSADDFVMCPVVVVCVCVCVCVSVSVCMCVCVSVIVAT